MENKELTEKLKNNVLSGLIMIVIGLLLCIFRVKLIETAIVTFGVLLIILGILELVKDKSSNGIVKIVIGAIMIFFSLLLWEIAVLIIGLLIVLVGLFKLKNAIAVQKYTDKIINKILTILPSAFTIIVGILLVLCKWFLANTLCLILGIFILINGVLTFLNLENNQ